MNMVGLWFVGANSSRPSETRRFVALYLAGGVIGGLAQILYSPLPLVGASAAVCAVLLAFTTLFPRLEMMALLLFVLPVRMRARTLGYGLVLASIVFWISGLMPDVGHSRTLAASPRAGCLASSTGAAWAGGDESSGSWSWNGPSPWRKMHSARHLRAVPTLDEILDKIREEGIDNLTSEERRILEESRQRRR